MPNKDNNQKSTNMYVCMPKLILDNIYNVPSMISKNNKFFEGAMHFNRKENRTKWNWYIWNTSSDCESSSLAIQWMGDMKQFGGKTWTENDKLNLVKKSEQNKYHRRSKRST